MFVYWALFSYFVVGLLSERSSDRSHSISSFFLVMGALMTALLIGLRYHVGGDWNQYEQLFSFARYSNISQMLRFGDPAFQLLNLMVASFGMDFWLVNLISAAIFTWGLYRLAKTQPDPWLVMLAAIPYLVVVVAMGYTRQAVAIGILMAGLASLLRGGSVFKYALYVAAAALFHKTAVVGLPLVIFVSDRSRFFNALFLLASGILLYDIFLSDAADTFFKAYVDAQYNSQGASIRVAMSVIPATLFLLMRKRFAMERREDIVWRNFAYAAFGLLLLLLVLPSSTVVDRLALYILPLQLAVVSRLPRLGFGFGFGRVVAIGYSFAVLYVWLNYAVHASHWIPYRFFPVFE